MAALSDVIPGDEFDDELVRNTHPPLWTNPKPRERYHLVAIGGGTAGLVAAAGAALLGATTALIEKDLLGGDCLVSGCVPSKALIRSSRLARDLRDAADLGWTVPPGAAADFAAVMARMRKLRAKISRHDALERFRDLGVDIFLGEGRFTGRDSIAVGDTVLRFRKAVIATGSRPAVPDVPGLREAGFLTNQTVFSLTSRPRRLAVLGGGPIGCELGQAFARLGCDVTILHRGTALLEKEDADASDLVRAALLRDGVKIILGRRVTRVEVSVEGKAVIYEGGQVTADEILVAVGRAPNIEHLNLQAAGVNSGSACGVVVDDRLRTSNPNVFAAGDVCLEHKFTHAADAAGRLVVQNALFLGRRKVSDLVIPWATYTDPEVARVGLSEAGAKKAGIAVDVYRTPLSDVDRAIVDGEEEGFAKVLVSRGKIVGATIVARHAGEMIGEVTLAMTARLKLGKIGATIHPYPTQAEAVRKAADEYVLKKLTKPLALRAIGWWLKRTL